MGNLTSIDIPRSAYDKHKRKRPFFAPPKLVGVVPWKSLAEMLRTLNLPKGNWKMGTNTVGHLHGLEHVQGLFVARDGARGVLWREGSGVMVFNCSNFVAHHEEVEVPKKDEKEQKERKRNAVIREYE